MTDQKQNDGKVPASGAPAGQIERLMRAFHVSDETALAVQLNRGKHTLRVWRSRGAVPLEVVVDAARVTGYSWSWILDGSTATPTTADSGDTHVSPKEAELIRVYRTLSKKQRKLFDVFLTAMSKVGAA